jgi:hypothetical protein
MTLPAEYYEKRNTQKYSHDIWRLKFSMKFQTKLKYESNLKTQQ